MHKAYFPVATDKHMLLLLLLLLLFIFLRTATVSVLIWLRKGKSGDSCERGVEHRTP
jgi:hypothetical protein